MSNFLVVSSKVLALFYFLITPGMVKRDALEDYHVYQCSQLVDAIFHCFERSECGNSVATGDNICHIHDRSLSFKKKVTSNMI
jgi:hypothetical protein